MEAVSGGDRRIDRVLDPAFTRDVEQLTLEELRARREEAERVEADVSYLRRLLQGRLDILRAELERRAAGGERDVGELLDRLPAILADPHSPRFGALPRKLLPSRADQQRRRVERLVSDETVARLPELEVDELERTVAVLTTEEARVSATRRRVHQVMDALRQELTGRYRAGTADVRSLLQTSDRQAGSEDDRGGAGDGPAGG